ncbi:unnamed protein product [Heligmosomoides polygyrus]|uniref:CUB domain-containing protein n=1 Tax=Heligmosomoides polygyrus TaxID=6339 RepID=A0A183FL46_HELPZ|nr:unnamed protein product [Heligmosomoides polygyrus]
MASPVNSGWTKISSPGYPREFKEGQECSWLLVAPQGQVVEMQFIGEFEMYCKVRHSLCMDYVEVRNSTDFANTGMRYCCYGTPNTSIRSATTDLVVLFRSFYRGGRGFEARARALPANGQWASWTPWTPCTASCGACGSRMRTRVCSYGACAGEPVETQVCNTHPCSGLCQQKKTEDGECGGFLALLRGVRCKQ